MAFLFCRFKFTEFFSHGVISKTENLCKPKPQNLGQLKDNICREITNIGNELFPKVMNNITFCMQKVIGFRGAYIKH